MPARPVWHRLVSGSCPSAHGFDPRILSALGHPYAVALHLIRCGQLTGGLSPPGLRPCLAHLLQTIPLENGNPREEKKEEVVEEPVLPEC